MVSIYKDQRVGIFVDVQNMYYSARNVYSNKVDFESLLKKAQQNRKVTRAVAYAIESETPDEANFFDLLEEIGFEVKKKPLKEYYGGAKKGDWDMGIAIDALKMSDKLDVVVLVTGDGDFTHLVHHLKASGVRVEVMAFEESASKELKEAANNFLDMSENPDAFLM
ncbi:MAG: NYN domain-containing protein [Candidatus Thermoplasmatota archaeon]|nr:NYN domain-containing protein [Candidatus Thermoplasmatota archaeon]